jgi:hypothetical protein
MTQVIVAKGSGDRFLGGTLEAFASMALGLATIGIFGVLAYIVAQRTHEIGVRIALGAQKPVIFRLVLGRSFVLAAIGTAVGLIGSFDVIRTVASAAYSDSWLRALFIVGIATAIVLFAGLLAAYIPARRGDACGSHGGAEIRVTALNPSQRGSHPRGRAGTVNQYLVPRFGFYAPDIPDTRRSPKGRHSCTGTRCEAGSRGIVKNH